MSSLSLVPSDVRTTRTSSDPRFHFHCFARVEKVECDALIHFLVLKNFWHEQDSFLQLEHGA